MGLPPWAQVSPGRLAHIERVVALMDGWAAALALPPYERSRWLRAAWLHDALRDADPETLKRLAPGDTGPPALRHGPATANRAQQAGEDDPAVLAAIRYHSTGYAEWADVGQALYCADYLEPGRDFDRARRAELAERFPREPDEVVRDVAALRLIHAVRSGWPLPAATVDFWNRLTAPAASASR